MKGSSRSIEEIGSELAASPDVAEAYKDLPDDEQAVVRRAVLPTRDELQATVEQLAEEDPDLFGIK